MSSNTTIPKIIHQLWIGPKPAPTVLMDTWKEKHPDFTYIRWTEKEIIDRKMIFRCQDKIDDITEINGKADIMRWEILYKYGGIFIDADSICISPIDNTLLNTKSFAGWENEEVRTGLIATGTMGFPLKHKIVKMAIDTILNNEVSYEKTGKMAWETVGPMLLTNVYNTLRPSDFTIFPSYYFLPSHFTGHVYKGHGKIYAYQEWGSTKNSYDMLNEIRLPQYLLPFTFSVSVLICSYNTKAKYIKECLDSIRDQEGMINIEIVWIDDGSNDLNTKILLNLLNNFKNETRCIEIKYYKNETNKGVAYSLNRGLTLCSNDLVFRMDSDDIMVSNRLLIQSSLMNNYPHIMLCGAQVSYMDINKNEIYQPTQHQSLNWEQFVAMNRINHPECHWFLNHPTVCFRKSAVLECGSYNVETKQIEDFELWLKMLKKYKYIHNLPDVLLKYRIHDQQVTFRGGKEGSEYWKKAREKLLNDIIN